MMANIDPSSASDEFVKKIEDIHEFFKQTFSNVLKDEVNGKPPVFFRNHESVPIFLSLLFDKDILNQQSNFSSKSWNKFVFAFKDIRHPILKHKMDSYLHNFKDLFIL